MELDFKRFYKRLNQFSFFFRSRIEWIEASKSQLEKLNNVIKKNNSKF